MINLESSSYSYNDFNFSMQTSSGDKIDLKLYDEKSSSLQYNQSENSRSLSISLSHAYGYEFAYEGNGIDENDKLEIAKAMESVKPLLEKYFESVNESGSKSNAEVTNKAYELNSYLPEAKDINTQNFFNDKTLKTINKILEKAENQNEKILKEAQKLFDKLLKQSEQFELYM